MKNTVLEGEERQAIINLVEKFIDLTVTPFGGNIRGVVRVDKREPMYGGKGIVYLLQMYEEGELVNNRIGCYMVLPGKGTRAGFHTHGSRNEQELYCIVHGNGVYRDMPGDDKHAVREHPVKRGSITSVQGKGFHSIENTGSDPLIVFVITTNETTQ